MWKNQINRTWCFMCLIGSMAVPSQFYRFLARYSGRRRSVGVRLLPGRMPSLLPATLLVLSTFFAIAVLATSAWTTFNLTFLNLNLTQLMLNSFQSQSNVGEVQSINTSVKTKNVTEEACSSRSTPKPRPPSPPARPNVTFHTYACLPDYAAWYCLNGATCFTVIIGESVLYNCECADGYMGQRCEFKDLDNAYLPSRQRFMLETASIASGATIAVFLVVIVCVSVYIHYKRRQKQNRATSCVDGGSMSVGDLERRPQPFARRSSYHHQAYQLTRVTTEQYSAVLGKGDNHHHPPTTLYVQSSTNEKTPSGIQPHLQDAAPP